MRALEKYAVLCGGGTNHRIDLASGILIKNNHISLGGGLRAVLTRALEQRKKGQRVQVEVRTTRELEEALEYGAEAILLDNMSPAQVKSPSSASGKETALDSHRSLGRHRAREHPRLRRNGRGLHQRGRADPLRQGRRYLHEHRRGAELAVYDLAALEAALAGTIFAGKLHFSPVTGSTNTDALAAARAGAPHGSVYFADEQLAGRGRGDHAGTRPPARASTSAFCCGSRLSGCTHVPLFPLAAGLAAADAIRARHRDCDVDLRWPNDLLIGQRKTGGILVEAKTEEPTWSPSPSSASASMCISAFRPRLATPATSLDLEAGRRISRQALLIALLKSLERETLAACTIDAVQRDDSGARAQASTWVRGRQR